jgi:hypothetical protein
MIHLLLVRVDIAHLRCTVPYDVPLAFEASIVPPRRARQKADHTVIGGYHGNPPAK